ncbi:hypothetical protein CDD83_7365 [Cordyceps sp. RAO-2017]|nr:hypothetical protein CDD83_7365 [Cordyceps sp. RAO-2017]
MKIPYNRVHATGDVLFAARGGKLHSFSLLDGSHISTWQHPDVAAAPDVAARQAEADEPPAKRQRLLETGRDDAGDDAGAAEAGGDDAPDDAGARAEDEKQRQQQDETPQLARAPDRPVITQVTSSADGHHVLAVSGHDKTIWVFEHDGHGGLAKISQRYETATATGTERAVRSC